MNKVTFIFNNIFSRFRFLLLPIIFLLQRFEDYVMEIAFKKDNNNKIFYVLDFRGIHFASIYYFSIGFLKCSDSVVFYVFHFINVKDKNRI
jgi:hypothetical protein